MKKHLLKTLFLCLFALAGTTASAYDCEVDGIYYNLNTADQTASVTYKSGNYYWDAAVHIPEKIVYNGITYSVTSIGYKAFTNCSKLTELTIPNSVTFIGDQAFYGCSGLTELTIPNSVTSIGRYAFDGCRSLTELTIGSSVTSIGDYAFLRCSSLMELTIPNGVTSIGDGTFSDCSSLTELAIPNSITSIGDGAFYGCSSLTELTIPNSVTSIARRAFVNCGSLTELTLGSSVTSIGEWVVDGCSALVSLTSLNTTPATADGNAFVGIRRAYVTLHVPAGCKEAYAQAEGWRYFQKDILEDAVDGISPVVKGEQPTTDAVYTLDGVKLNTTSLQDLPSGIYIVNGKKVSVK